MNSEDNPGLQALYVKQAVRHLLVIDDCLERLARESNLNLMEAQVALQEQRKKLCSDNKEYAQAEETIRGIAPFLRRDLREHCKVRISEQEREREPLIVPQPASY